MRAAQSQANDDNTVVAMAHISSFRDRVLPIFTRLWEQQKNCACYYKQEYLAQNPPAQPHDNIMSRMSKTKNEVRPRASVLQLREIQAGMRLPGSGYRFGIKAEAD